MYNAIRVSVVVPVYNAERHILRTLESLAEQTLRNIEIIVVDDASTDGSRTVIENFRQQSQVNIIYLRQPENQGVHNARLLGLQHAKGEWVGFVDADDTLQPKMYEKMLDAGVRENVDIVICGAYRVTENGKRLSTKVSFKKERKVSESIFQEFCQLKFGSGSLWNKLYRRDVIMPFKTLYFPWRQDINEDMLLNIGCFSKATSVLAIKDVLYHYTYNSNSVSSQIDHASAFVKTFQAYAIAVSTYDSIDKREQILITEMYRKMMSWPTFQVSELTELTYFEDQLKEATKIIFSAYPTGLAALSARTLRNNSKKKCLAKLLKKLTLRE